MGEPEIELKLGLTARAAAKLRRAPEVHRAKRGRARNRRLIAVYFDTDDLALRRARIALRIRQEGGRRVQTVKAPAGPAGGMQTRTEVESPIDGTEPDLARVAEADADMAERVRAAIGGAALKPVFSTDVKRTLWTLDWSGSTLELALDTGEIRSGARVKPVSEAELELKAGDPRAILDFAACLRERIVFTVMAGSKAASGYALFRGEAPAPVKAEDAGLDPGMSARAALRTILAGGVAQLIANEPVVEIGEDPEAVHQARIAVRRMRAALSAFKPVIEKAPRKPLAKRLRWLQQALGPARDWDVFLEETLEPVLAEAPGHAGLKRLAKRARKHQAAGYKRARKAIARKRYCRLILALEGWGFTENPTAEATRLGDFSRSLLQQRYEAVLADAGADPAALEETALHQLRIEIKKLRYAVEFFGSLYPGKVVKPFLKTCKGLQECLGGLNDAAVARRLLVELAGGAEDPRAVFDPDAIDRIEAFHARRVENGLAQLAGTWRTFRAQPVFW